MWIANISTGQTLAEANRAPGEKSPWQQLLDECERNSWQITGLRLKRNGIEISALSPKMCDGYFHAEEVHMVGNQIRKHFQGVGSVIGENVYIIWIDDQGNIFADVRELSSCRIHTTLRNSWKIPMEPSHE